MRYNRNSHKTNYQLIVIICAVLMLLPTDSNGFDFFSSLAPEEQAKSYIDKTVPEIIKDWNTDTFVQHIHPELLKTTSGRQIEQLFFRYKTLGFLKKYHGSEGEIKTVESSTGDEMVMGVYKVTADFEKGPATISVVIVKVGDSWKFLTLLVDAQALLDAETTDPTKAKDTDDGIPQSKEEMEKLAEDFLNEKYVVEKRHQLDKIFFIAKNFAENNLEDKAMQVYKKALDIDPANLAEQYNLAQLLVKNDRPKEALPRLSTIYEFSEDEELFLKAKKMLTELRFEFPASQQPDFDTIFEFILVPEDHLNSQIVKELRYALQERMGMKVSISPQTFTLEEPDRKLIDQYITEVFTLLSQRMSPLQKKSILTELGLDDEALQSPYNQSRFIIYSFSMLGAEGKKMQRVFEANLKEMGDKGQYHVTSAFVKLRLAFPLEENKAYIGVTSKDLYSENSNYNFGSGLFGGSYGIISYHRFRADYNKENQNRPRLVKRLLKQALSTSNFLLGFPRCDTLYCARAYPKSLAEHDGKSDELCQICKSRLEEFKLKLLAGRSYPDGNRDTALMNAVFIGQIDTVQALLDKGADVNVKGRYDMTALTYAVRKGYIGIVQALLDKGADTNTRNKDGFTPLMIAAHRGHNTIVEKLLNAGAEINAKDNSGWTALMSAAMKGHTSSVQALLEKNAEVNAKDDKNQTALMLATEKGHTLVVKALLDKGAEVNVKNSNEFTALMLAAEKGYQGIVQALLDKGAALNAKSKKEFTPLIFAAGEGHSAIVQDLLNAGADVNEKQKYGFTSLMLAAYKGHPTTVDVLINNGADVNVKNNEERTALLIAAEKGHNDIIKSLLDKGADVNAKIKTGCTALILAARAGHNDCIKTLLARGANIEDKNVDGYTALMHAATKGKSSAVENLLENGAEVNTKGNDGFTALMLAAEKGYEEILRTLLNAGAEVNAKNAAGWTALIVTSQSTNVPSINTLLNRGADINAKNAAGLTALTVSLLKGLSTNAQVLINRGADVNIKTNKNWTALMIAAKNGLASTVQVLLDNGADIKATRKDGFTALIYAVKHGHTDIVKVLMEKGVDVNTKLDVGITALMVAALYGHTDIVKILLNNGADVNMRDQQNYTAMMYAIDKGHNEIIELLEKAGADKSVASVWSRNFDNRLYRRPKAFGFDYDSHLIAAAKEGKTATVVELLHRGANINAQNDKGQTALMHAALKGHIDTVQLLLNMGAKVNLKTTKGSTALMLAVKNNHSDIIELLKAAGARE